MGNLLFDSELLVINPALATLIGLNEAIVLQQMHYWLKKSAHHIDDRKWVYNSVPDWAKQFPFFSESTIKRAITSLEKSGLIISANYNKDKRDQTKWYSINYPEVDALNIESVDDASGQIDPMEEVSLTRPLPETTTEITKNPLPPCRKKFDALSEKPENVSTDAWRDWVNHRREIKKPLTPTTCSKICSMLADHINPDAVINLSIERGWQGLFPDKITEPPRVSHSVMQEGLTDEQRKELAMYELLEGR